MGQQPFDTRDEAGGWRDSGHAHHNTATMLSHDAPREKMPAAARGRALGLPQRLRAPNSGSNARRAHTDSAPATISVSSVVIFACLKRLYWTWSFSIISDALVEAESMAVMREACSEVTFSRMQL